MIYKQDYYTALSSQDYCMTNVLQARLFYSIVQFSAVPYCKANTIVLQMFYKQDYYTFLYSSVQYNIVQTRQRL